MTNTEAIQKFLAEYATHPIAKLYKPGMEVQVNVDPRDGQRDGASWTDGNLRWYNIRLQSKEKAENTIGYPINQYTYAIGFTGWNYNDQISEWVGFDLDSIIGHKKGLTPGELEQVVVKVKELPWISIYRSKSGNGYHIYAHLDKVTGIENHHQHRQVAKIVLDKINGLTGSNFAEKVDVFGAILWVWHKEQSERAWEPIQQSSDKLLLDLSRSEIVEQNKSSSYRLSNQLNHDALTLSEEHQRLINFLQENNYSWQWNSDKGLLICHTFNLKEAHEKLKMRGSFNTCASGQSGAAGGTDHNCFCVPIEDGGWIVRRFGVGTEECESWTTDDKGYAISYLNTYPSLHTAIKAVGGTEASDSQFSFTQSEAATQFFASYGCDLIIPKELHDRPVDCKQINTDRIQVAINRNSNIDPGFIEGWVKKGHNWVQVIQLPTGALTQTIRVPHDKVRHLVISGKGESWVVQPTDDWIEQNVTNVKLFLLANGFTKGNVDVVMGKCVNQFWTLVNKPFEPEYPGIREWNKDAPQFAIEPREGDFFTWTEMLNHLGQRLTLGVEADEWCRINNIATGRDYLLLWLYLLVQSPRDSLPYLFFHGPQNSGKSTFHESIRLLLHRGVGCVRADRSLTSEFNGELENAILCVVEETDLSRQDSRTYNRIKDYVTGLTISIRKLYQQSRDVENTTHWVQVGNKPTECPVFPGDTRIVVINVPNLNTVRGKTEFFNNLRKESSAFLHYLLNYRLPPREGRLNIPVIATGEKEDLSELRWSKVERFIADNLYPTDGGSISFTRFKDLFNGDMLDVELMRELKEAGYPIGKINGGLCIGNLTEDINVTSSTKLQRWSDQLK